MTRYGRLLWLFISLWRGGTFQTDATARSPPLSHLAKRMLPLSPCVDDRWAGSHPWAGTLGAQVVTSGLEGELDG